MLTAGSRLILAVAETLVTKKGGISAKRYVLYKPNNDNTDFKIYKYSTHGLGHLQGIDSIQWWKDILFSIYHPEQKNTIQQRYTDKYATSSFTITNWEFYKRFESFNRYKTYQKKIKPFNFVTISTSYKIDSETGKSIIPLLPKVDTKCLDQAPFIPFIDYKSGTNYPKSDSLDTRFYWKPISEVFEDYIKHNEVKFDGKIGVMSRKHVVLNQYNIRYVGKEANNIERMEITGIFDGDMIEYSNIQKRVRKIIDNLSEEKALSLGISRRLYYYLKRKSKSHIQIKITKKLHHILENLVTEM